MHLRLLSFALLSLTACAGARARPAPLVAAVGEPLTYRAVVTPPAGAASLVLRVRTPELGGAAGLRAVRASVLVGNAAIELALGQDENARAEEHVSLSWRALGAGAAHGHELQIETHGKPIELALRLARDPAAADGLDLERALVLGTSATADGRPLEAVATRLERVR